MKMNLKDANAEFVCSLAWMSALVSANAEDHGFYVETEEMLQRLPYKLQKRFDALVLGEKIALMHSELSEALEAVRKDPSGPDRHCPEFTNLEIELADCVIRILDIAHYNNYRLGEAILAKHEFNLTRPYKHNKQS